MNMENGLPFDLDLEWEIVNKRRKKKGKALCMEMKWDKESYEMVG